MNRSHSNSRIFCWFAIFMVCFWSTGSTAFAPLELPTKATANEWLNGKTEDYTSSLPMQSSVLCFPPEWYDENVVYRQLATDVRIQGYKTLVKTCQKWDEYFQSDKLSDSPQDLYDENVSMQIERISTISSTTIVTKWNVTWVDPSVQWLVALAKVARWTPVYVTYVEKASQPATVSYRAILKLFSDAFQTKKITIPLACIQGSTTCEFAEREGRNEDTETFPSPSTANKGRIVSVQEELVYAQDLKRGSLQNRKCAQDLRLFLEVARRQERPSMTVRGWPSLDTVKDADEAGTQQQSMTLPIRDWDDWVATSLPWSSVPGSGSLDFDADAPGEEFVPLAFLGIAGTIWVTFVALAAPELIGQSLFGPPNYIVPPSELNSIY